MVLETLQRIMVHSVRIDEIQLLAIQTYTPIDLFELLAFGTWNRLRLGCVHNVHQGEETITDINLLEMAQANFTNLRLWKCPKDQEPLIGIDWEWLIRVGSNPWRRYAVQAKRLNATATAYENLNHQVGSKTDPKNRQKQIDILKRYADAKRAMPLYCFYNHIDLKDYSLYWHCELPLDIPQFGCTVTPLNVVAEALHSRRRPTTRRFQHIHSSELTFPWRCLFKCDHLLDKYKNDEGLRRTSGVAQEYEALPPEVVRLFRTDDPTAAKYISDFPYVPGRVLVAEIQQIEPELERQSLRSPPLPTIRQF